MPPYDHAQSFKLPAQRKHFYGGAWHASLGGGEMDVTSPATGESLGRSRYGVAAIMLSSCSQRRGREKR